jgi:uncharacterized protein YodC (DUF2158 family)
VENLKAGETVRLKSGGPLMTVQAAYKKWVVCEWFDEQGKRHVDKFDPVTLKTAVA